MSDILQELIKIAGSPKQALTELQAVADEIILSLSPQTLGWATTCKGLQGLCESVNHIFRVVPTEDELLKALASHQIILPPALDGDIYHHIHKAQTAVWWFCLGPTHVHESLSPLWKEYMLLAYAELAYESIGSALTETPPNEPNTRNALVYAKYMVEMMGTVHSEPTN
jgi:hypothetical protein